MSGKSPMATRRKLRTNTGKEIEAYYSPGALLNNESKRFERLPTFFVENAGPVEYDLPQGRRQVGFNENANRVFTRFPTLKHTEVPQSDSSSINYSSGKLDLAHRKINRLLAARQELSTPKHVVTRKLLPDLTHRGGAKAKRSAKKSAKKASKRSTKRSPRAKASSKKKTLRRR